MIAKASKVVVSLVSNCMNSILKEYIKELADPLIDGKKIILGECFSYEGVIKKKKP